MNTSKTLALVAVLLSGSEAQARNPNPGILPPDRSFHGKPYSDWTAEWWKWWYSIPVSTNPMADTTGEWGDLNQFGPVWFLAGTYDGMDPVTRSLTVPHDKWLLVPIVNWEWTNFEVAGDAPWTPEQRDTIRADLEAFIDSVDRLRGEIDGVWVKDLESYRFSTPDGEEYMVTVPDDNWLAALGYDVPAFTYGPTIDVGVYVMLEPLSVGEHTIHFAAAAGPRGYATDVTYELTVE